MDNKRRKQVTHTLALSLGTIIVSATLLWLLMPKNDDPIVAAAKEHGFNLRTKGADTIGIRSDLQNYEFYKDENSPFSVLIMAKTARPLEGKNTLSATLLYKYGPTNERVAIQTFAITAMDGKYNGPLMMATLDPTMAKRAESIYTRAEIDAWKDATMQATFWTARGLGLPQPTVLRGSQARNSQYKQAFMARPSPPFKLGTKLVAKQFV